MGTGGNLIASINPDVNMLVLAMLSREDRQAWAPGR